MIERGFKQGAVIQYSELDATMLEAITEGRGRAMKRARALDRRSIFVVLTQDCDLSNDGVEFIELAIGRRKNGRSRTVRNVRSFSKLRLDHQSQAYEFENDQLALVEKSVFESWQVTSELDSSAIEQIVVWRTLSYLRKPFPHNFNVALRSPLSSGTIEDFLRQYRDAIQDLYIVVDPDDDEQAQHYDANLMLLLHEEVEPCRRGLIFSELSSMLRELDANGTIRTQIGNLQTSPKIIETHLSPVCYPEDITYDQLLQYTRYTIQVACYD